jgi:uncharacterized protein YbjT (DUF2867 family)
MIAVTGATGHVGSTIVRTLRQHNLPVRAIVRKGSEYYWLNDTGCTFFFADLRDPQSLKRALRDVDFVISASNVPLESQDNNHRVTTVEGNQALFEAAIEKGVKKMVLISCMGVDFSPPAFQARRIAEEALIQSGLDYTILRACIHEQFFLQLAFRILDEGSVRVPGHGNNQLSVLPATDLANMAAASLDMESVQNQVITVGGAQTISAMEALHLASEVLNITPKVTTIPAVAAKLATRVGKPFRRYANRTAEHRIWFTEDLVANADQTVAAYGLPTANLREAMSHTATTMADLRDPERREARMVHPQFYATVYEPGTANLSDLADGPAPRKD